MGPGEMSDIQKAFHLPADAAGDIDARQQDRLKFGLSPGVEIRKSRSCPVERRSDQPELLDRR